MYLFIFESIGTSELILIGIVALMFLGPRKLPEIAKKIGKIMSEFRNTTNEFKQTWEREVNVDEEAKALKLDFDEPTPVARENSILNDETPAQLEAPAIREVDPSVFEQASVQPEAVPVAETEADDPNDKRNWL